jgi:hypothetical protein
VLGFGCSGPPGRPRGGNTGQGRGVGYANDLCNTLSAKEPHACLSVECIKCMATSENVVSAGQTLK